MSNWYRCSCWATTPAAGMLWPSQQAAGARVEQVRIELGGKVSVCGTRTLQDHNKSEYDLDAVYFGGDE